MKFSTGELALQATFIPPSEPADIVWQNGEAISFGKTTKRYRLAKRRSDIVWKNGEAISFGKTAKRYRLAKQRSDIAWVQWGVAALDNGGLLLDRSTTLSSCTKSKNSSAVSTKLEQA